MAGRKPTPTALKRLTGNPGKRPLPEDEPEPSRGNVHQPAHLDTIARREWRRLELILTAMRVLTDADYVTLAVLCQQLSIWERVSRQVEKQGMLVEYVRGTRKLVGKAANGEAAIENLTEVRRHPGLKVINDAIAIINRCCSELGLTPAARTKVKTIGRYKQDNPWEKIVSFPA
jgi:P27 family predicted phage terminase small subunit